MDGFMEIYFKYPIVAFIIIILCLSPVIGSFVGGERFSSQESPSDLAVENDDRTDTATWGSTTETEVDFVEITPDTDQAIETGESIDFSAEAYDQKGDLVDDDSSLFAATVGAVRSTDEGEGSFFEDESINADNPIEIYDWHDLNDVRNNLSADHVLMNDLDENTEGYMDYNNPDTNGWEPIGYFAGTFDGNGHTISDLYINNSESGVGLFGNTESDALVEDIGLLDVNVTGSLDDLGSLIGVNNGNVSSSYANGSMVEPESPYVGGLVGDNTGNISHSSANVSTDGGNYVGGLTGRNLGDVFNSYSLGDVNGTSEIGGLVGRLNGKVDNSYATGYVSGDDRVGGLIGYKREGSVENSFWDNESSGIETSAGGTGKTTSEMKDVATFTNTTTEGLSSPWDFVGDPYDDEGDEDIWDIDNHEHINDGYPYFSWRNTSELKISSTENGTVIGPGEGTYDYDAGTVVALEAVADEGYNFNKWIGDNETIDDTTDNTTTITMKDDYTITAEFAINTYTLDVSSTEGGNVPQPGEDTFEYDHGTTVDLEAVANEGYHFVEWTGDQETIADSQANITTITMESDYTITAEFAINTYTLNISSTDGGEVKVPGEGTHTYDHGETVPLEAVADEDHKFVEWIGDNGTVDDTTANKTTIKMVDNYTIMAKFDEAYELRIEPPDNGTVPAPGEGTFTYKNGTIVALTAEANDGYHFVKWTGDNGTVENTKANQTTITMEDNYTITAVFAVNTYTLNISSTAGGSLAVPGEGNFTYDHGTVVDLEAVEDENYTFIEWTGANGTIANTKSNQTTIDILDNYTITAEFLQKPFFDVEIVDHDEEVIEEEKFVVNYTVTNMGAMTGTMDVHFVVYDNNSNEVYSDEVEGIELNGGESYDEGNFSWEAEEPGDYSFIIASEDDDYQEESLSVKEDISSDGGSSDRWWPYLILALAAFAVIIGGGVYKKKSAKKEPIIDDIFLISQRNSILISHYTRRLKPDRDSDILASMFDVVQSFIEDSFQDTGDWKLNKLEFGENKVVVERGEYVYMAVVYEGKFTEDDIQEIRDLIEKIEDKFEEELKEWSGIREELRGIEEIIQDFFS
ncbi:MAG: InlB B-repeat-containing protein [Thermoplasmata archaeon]